VVGDALDVDALSRVYHQDLVQKVLHLRGEGTHVVRDEVRLLPVLGHLLHPAGNKPCVRHK